MLALLRRFVLERTRDPADHIYIAISVCFQEWMGLRRTNQVNKLHIK